MSEQFPPREILVCEGQSEADDEFDASAADGTPYIAIKHLDEGFVVEYDLATVDYDDDAEFELREEAVTELEELVDDYVEEAEETTREGEVGWSLGSRSGHFVGLPRERARELASEIADILRDEENLRPVSEE